MSTQNLILDPLQLTFSSDSWRKKIFGCFWLRLKICLITSFSLPCRNIHAFICTVSWINASPIGPKFGKTNFSLEFLNSGSMGLSLISAYSANKVWLKALAKFSFVVHFPYNFVIHPQQMQREVHCKIEPHRKPKCQLLIGNMNTGCQPVSG